MKANTAVLLLQLGTPDSPKFWDVAKYLSQFLNDKRVIDFGWLKRKLLVNGIIVPFRTKNSSEEYQKLWTPEGSPLLTYTRQTAELLQEKLGDTYHVDFAMRYQNPSIAKVVESFKKQNFKQIIVLPLFPQYASASTGSAVEETMRVISQWWVIPQVNFISQYHDHPTLAKAWTAIGAQYPQADYDHVLFSFHGLPIRQLDKVYENGLCQDHSCEHESTRDNQYCYKATCYATARTIAKNLNIAEEKYTVCFQSRLGKGWVEPFADEVIENLGKSGKKKLLVFSPAFTADCLETLQEIAHGYLELFQENGGEKLQLVPSLNTHPLWIETLKELVISNTIEN